MLGGSVLKGGTERVGTLLEGKGGEGRKRQLPCKHSCSCSEGWGEEKEEKQWEKGGEEILGRSSMWSKLVPAGGNRGEERLRGRDLGGAIKQGGER